MGKTKDNPRVLLFQPPVYDFALYDLYLKPFGLLRVGKWLEGAGYEVGFLDALSFRDTETNRILGVPRRFPDGTGKFNKMRSPLPAGIQAERYLGRYGVLPEVLKKKLADFKPDAVFISSGMTYWAAGVREAVSLVRESLPGIPCIAGGIYASLMPDHCSSYAAPDYVVSSGTEKKVGEILKSLGLIEPAGRIPYAPLMLEDVWKDAGIIRLNEGCPLNCDYCASGLLSSGFRSGDSSEAFEVMKEMHERFGTVNFAFYDDALLVDADRGIKPFLERLLREDIDLNFFTPNAVHINFLDRETAALMKRSGFRDVRLGYESSSDDFHSIHDSKVAGGGLSSAVEALKSAGFKGSEITAYVLGGLPRQAAGEVERSLTDASGAGIRVSLAEYSPVPGTALWEKSVSLCGYPLEDEPLYHNNSFFPMNWEGFTREDLQRLKRLAVSLNRDLDDDVS